MSRPWRTARMSASMTALGFSVESVESGLSVPAFVYVLESLLMTSLRHRNRPTARIVSLWAATSRSGNEEPIRSLHLR
ncbi:hypothetical protein B0H12DRAFT_1148813 [Mycena haematopus]|nr:hypothetical protein B0H12DRAFT_1148813 [Mycena haematopus]